MSQAPVGQRSAHRPQCTHTSSSFTITRFVCTSASETYSGCDGLRRGAVSLSASESSGVSSTIVRQSVGQTSMHASHSMQSGAVKCVSQSQLRQRSASFSACYSSKPSSTSTATLASRSVRCT